MKADIGRVSFDPLKSFSRVLLQQGRPQLESDANEQVSILLAAIRDLAADVLGPWAGSPGAFRAEPLPTGGADLALGPGVYYVQGVRCENAPPDRAGATPATYRDQPWLPGGEGLPVPPSGSHDLLVYLDVWERLVTADEDDTLRDSALGGLDTAARAQVVWQVRAVPVPAADLTGLTCRTVVDSWAGLRARVEPGPRGLLRARARVAPAELDRPCTVDPRAGYRFDENALFRVEVHRGGPAGEATFAWSMDNGSAVAAVESFGGRRLMLTALPRDPRLTLRPGDGVALEWDAQVLRGEPAPFFRVESVEPGDPSVRLDAAPAPVPPEEHPRLRRWDQAIAGREPLADDGCITIVETSADDDDWIDLHHGVQVQFRVPDVGEASAYRTGDYWLIPARTALGDVVWPADPGPDGQPVPRLVPPHGVEHRYAPVAWVSVDASGTVTVHERFVRSIVPPVSCPGEP